MASGKSRPMTVSNVASGLSPAVIALAKPIDDKPSSQSVFTSRIAYILYDQRAFIRVAVTLLLLESVVSILILRYQGYTEIDWRAYMDEVRGVIVDGEFDYKLLRGDTGPLVYPAGFVWLYAILYYITEKGSNIYLAQCIFLLLYISFTAVIFTIYYYYKSPPYLLFFLILSKRIHSIFILRCFNDCFAMFFCYISIIFFIKNRYTIGIFFISFAISIKMNILLFIPALTFLIIERFSNKNNHNNNNNIIIAILHILLLFLCQILIGLPFILRYPQSYFSRAFEFSRQFFYIWTVNYKFIPEEVFLNKYFSFFLLIGHLSILVIVLHCLSRVGVFHTAYNSILSLLSTVIPGLKNQSSSQSVSTAFATSSSSSQSLSAEHIIQLLFLTNFIGIAFARSLHYQFYVWYFHTLPLITFIIKIPIILQIIILLFIEISFNIYPSNFISSLMLTVAHVVIVVYILIYCWERYQIREQAKSIRLNQLKEEINKIN